MAMREAGILPQSESANSCCGTAPGPQHDHLQTLYPPVPPPGHTHSDMNRLVLLFPVALFAMHTLAGAEQDGNAKGDTITIETHLGALAEIPLEYKTHSKDKTLFAGWYRHGWDEVISVHDAETGKQIQKIVGHGDEVKELRFSPDNKILATRCINQSRRGWALWDVSTGELIMRLSAQEKTAGKKGKISKSRILRLYHQIKAGQSREEVEKLLGEPLYDNAVVNGTVSWYIDKVETKEIKGSPWGMGGIKVFYGEDGLVHDAEYNFQYVKNEDIELYHQKFGEPEE